MKRLSIKLKVTILCTLLAALTVCIALGAMFGSEQRLIANYYRDSLLSTAQLAMDDVHYEDGDLEIDRNLDELPSVRVALYSNYGDLIYGRHIIETDFAPGEIYTALGKDGTRWHVHDVLLTPDGGSAVYLRCYMPSSAADRIRINQREFLFILLPGLVLVAALGGYGISKRAFRPVAQIAETAQSITDGTDLQKRIGLHGANDEIHRMASVFDGMLERLEQAFQRERQFTSDVSHELRTPIAGILMQSDFALSKYATDDDRREALEDIHDRAQYISGLIDRLLTLARMDAKQISLQLEDVNLNRIADAIAKAVETPAAQRSIRVERYSEGDVCLRADKTLLMQAALNLAVNAVRYGREGGFVRIRTGVDAQKPFLSVEDDGVGISNEDQAHIFKRFYQADAARHGDGAGLGLALTDCIVRLHGGHILLESALGSGSLFTIFFQETEDNP